MKKKQLRLINFVISWKNRSISHILDLHFGPLEYSLVRVNWLFKRGFLHVCNLTIVLEANNCVIKVAEGLKIFLSKEIAFP